MARQSDIARNYSLNKFVITPSKGRNTPPVDLGADGTTITDFYYYESILNDTLKATVTYSDIGQYPAKESVTKTVISGMPIEGGETVNIFFKDMNHDTTLKIDLQVRSPNQNSIDTKKSLTTLDLVSEESVINLKKIVTKSYSGPISESFKDILKNVVNTTKDLKFERTNELKFEGKSKHPFHLINSFSNKCVPDLDKAYGNTAGFFFYETSEGFNFRSIDGLISGNDESGRKKNVKRYSYTGTVNTSTGYDDKILEINSISPSGDILKKLEAGTYSTRTIIFDPFNCYYEVINPNAQGDSSAKGSEKNLTKAGKNLPKINPKFNIEGNNQDFSKTKYYLLDTGTMPTGPTRQQIQKSKTINFDPKNIANQASMRYNQFFSSLTSIVIFGDLSLHAGDLIWIDPPELSNKQTPEMDEQFGGYYVIVDLCHYYSLTDGCYTRLIATRDSVGKTGNPF